MHKLSLTIRKFLTWSCKMAGQPLTFMLAWGLLIVWAIIGFIRGFSTNWLLLIDTIATINASLMVFIIQNTQNRESKALHLKIDGLIKSVKDAERDLIAIEELEEEELEKIRRKLFSKM